MVKLMVLVLVVALPDITYSAPPVDQELEKEYEKVYEELLEKDKQVIPPDDYAGLDGYVCCNSPPRIPNQRKTRGRALSLIKRAGIGYGAGRRAFDEFPRRNAIGDLPQDNSFDSIDTIRSLPEASASRASTLALVKRLMRMANRKRLGSTALSDGLPLGGMDEPMLVVNYPGKRGGFVGSSSEVKSKRAPTGPGGNNLSYEDFMNS